LLARASRKDFVSAFESVRYDNFNPALVCDIFWCFLYPEAITLAIAAAAKPPRSSESNGVAIAPAAFTI
jgi:hypothetical protein